MKNSIAYKIQLWGKARRTALREFGRVLKKWELKMPKGEVVLVSDFGLKEFYNTGLIECWISNEEKHGYCGKYLFVFDNQTCPEHFHKIKHETFFVVKGKVRMKINGKTITKKEGEKLVMPAGVKHSFTGMGDALLLEVSTPCVIKDNYFSDKRIRKLFDEKR